MKIISKLEFVAILSNSRIKIPVVPSPTNRKDERRWKKEKRFVIILTVENGGEISSCPTTRKWGKNNIKEKYKYLRQCKLPQQFKFY